MSKPAAMAVSSLVAAAVKAAVDARAPRRTVAAVAAAAVAASLGMLAAPAAPRPKVPAGDGVRETPDVPQEEFALRQRLRAARRRRRAAATARRAAVRGTEADHVAGDVEMTKLADEGEAEAGEEAAPEGALHHPVFVAAAGGAGGAATRTTVGCTPAARASGASASTLRTEEVPRSEPGGWRVPPWQRTRAEVSDEVERLHREMALAARAKLGLGGTRIS